MALDANKLAILVAPAALASFPTTISNTAAGRVRAPRVQVEVRILSRDKTSILEAVNSNGDIQENIVVKNIVSVAATQGGTGQVRVFMTQDSSPGVPRGDTLAPNISFPITDFFRKHLRYQAGVVDPKLVAPELVQLVASGRAHLSFITSAVIGIEDVPIYYERFYRHEEIKVYIHFP